MLNNGHVDKAMVIAQEGTDSALKAQCYWTKAQQLLAGKGKKSAGKADAEQVRKWCIAWLLSIPAALLVYLKDRSAQTVVHACTLRQKKRIKLAVSPSHSVLALGQPVPVLTYIQTCLPVRICLYELASSTEVRSYFSKYGHRVSRKYRNHDINNASLLPMNIDFALKLYGS